MSAGGGLPSLDSLLAPFSLAPDRPLAVGVSGGPDSMALLLLAADHSRATGRPVHALTVDHGLRAEAAVEAQQVAAWAALLDIPHHTLSEAHDVRPHADIQAWARALRYRLMGAWCAQHGMAALLVAHTQDDQAETFMLRLGRGSGVDGLAAMSPDTTRDGMRLLRPFLSVRRESLLSLLADREQAFFKDPSNDDARHARVRMRGLMPQLSQEGMTAQRLAATAERMAVAREALDGWTRAHIRSCVTFHGGGYAEVDRAAFLDVPEEIQLRSLVALVRGIGGGVYRPRLAHTKSLLSRLCGPGFTGATLAGLRFEARAHGLIVCREGRALAAPQSLENASACVWDGRFDVSVQGAGANRGLRVGALGGQNWRDVRGLSGMPAYPAIVGAALPAVFRGKDLVEIPGFSSFSGASGPAAVAHFVAPMRAGLVSGPIATGSSIPFSDQG